MVRGSLGRNIDLSARSTNEEYPLYCLPVTTFLSLDKWVPHQELLAQNKLVEIKRGDTESEVIFCSHQWSSWEHPDPKGEWLSTLQTVIRKLMKGKTSVASNGMLDAVYQYHMQTTGAEWARKLPGMYLWIDYISIPQPGALVSEASDELIQDLDANGDGKVTPSELANADASKTKRRSSDHRQLAGQESVDARLGQLVEQLKAAVDSIPSYIERCSMMWIVVPPVKHQSLDEQICDFASWRKRGWCRMEFAACKLACGDDMPLMVIKSAIDAPEYFNPCDIFKLCPSRGDFSVEADRGKVNGTLSTMLSAKAASYEERHNDVTLARILKAFAPIFVPHEAGAAAAAAAAPAAPEGETALARLQRLMKWRGDAAEAAWEAECGWNLLTLAVAMNDEAAVDELLARPAAEVSRLLNAKGADLVVPGGAVKKGPLHRREPLGQKLLQYAERMSPLLAAMTFSSAGVVRKLLDAGADVERDGLTLLGERPCTFRGACIAGRAENVRALLERFPQYANAANEMGATCLHFAAFSSACLGQREVVRALLDHGASKEALHSVHLFNGTPLTASCGTYDQDPAAIKMMLEAGADPTKPEALPGKLKFLRRLSGVLRLTGSVQMRGIHTLIKSTPLNKGRTPTHMAAQRGDIAVVKVLAEHAKSHPEQSKDRAGATPLQLCERASAPCREVPALMQQAIEKALPTDLAETSTGKPKKAPRGKAKYQVAPGPAAAAVEAEAGDAAWRDAIEEFVAHNPSPSMARPAAAVA